MTSMAHALAQALIDSGVEVITHVPGHGATQTFEAFRELTGKHLPISFHEEPAYAVAHGAALTGVRSACVIKSHGLTKAMNAVMDSLSCGTTAGMLNLIFEDKTGAHSDNIIEIEPVIKAAEMPYTRGTAVTAYDTVAEAYTKHLSLQLPYTVLFDSAEIMSGASVGKPDRIFGISNPIYHRDPMRHLVCPIFAPYQREVLRQKLHDTNFKESVPRPQMPILPDSLPPSYQAAVRPYLPLFDVFRTMDVDFVCGDAGVSTLSAFPPYEIAHAALYMGGSIPTAVGAYLAGMRRSWSFIGDFSFIAAGHYGLIEALLRDAPVKVLIFANGRAQTTGGQPLDLNLIRILLKGYEKYIRLIDDPADAESTANVLKEANDSKELRIIIARFTKEDSGE